MSRARRPHFGFHDEQALLKALATRDWLIKCASGCTDSGSARYQKCRAAQAAIDDLVEELTGNRHYLSLKAHGTPRGWWRKDDTTC